MMGGVAEEQQSHFAMTVKELSNTNAAPKGH
jgi:hypothetical protein